MTHLSRTPALACPKNILAALMLALCLTGAAAAGTTYYVSSTGNNSNNGLTTTTAWRNVQYAASHVAAGDTVNILGGVYNETVNIPAYIASLQKQMRAAAKELDFETAAELRDKIRSLQQKELAVGVKVE